jgi:hypothetical protein
MLVYMLPLPVIFIAKQHVEFQQRVLIEKNSFLSLISIVANVKDYKKKVGWKKQKICI